MRDAVADKAVVPLLYEGREVLTDVDETQIDRWFEVHTRNLTAEQTADLKRKMSRRGKSRALNHAFNRSRSMSASILSKTSREPA